MDGAWRERSGTGRVSVSFATERVHANVFQLEPELFTIRCVSNLPGLLYGILLTFVHRRASSRARGRARHPATATSLSFLRLCTPLPVETLTLSLAMRSRSLLLILDICPRRLM